MERPIVHETLDLLIVSDSPECEEAERLFNRIVDVPKRVHMLPGRVSDYSVLVPFIRDRTGYRHFGLETIRAFLEEQILSPQ